MAAVCVWAASALVWLAVAASCVAFLPVSLDVKVMVMVIAGLVLHLLQRIMGPMRRHCEKFNTQFAAMAAYSLPSVLAFYSVNAMWSSSYHNIYYILWCILLLVLSSLGTVEMKVNTLRATVDQRWRLLQLILYLACLQWPLLWTDSTLRPLTAYCLWSTMTMLFVFLVFKPRVAVLDYNSKEFADYMRQECRSLFNEDPNSAGKYPVVQGHRQIITVNDIEQRSPRMRQYRDTFLSFSYCQLLARRYFGFHCAEEGNAEVRDFALAQLHQDYSRAFSIVELQLAFLHDYFFSSINSVIMKRACTCRLSGAPGRVNIAEMVQVLWVVLQPVGVLVWSLMVFTLGGTFGIYKLTFHVLASLILALARWFQMKPVMPMYWSRIWDAFQNDCCSVWVHEYVRWCRSPHWSSTSQPYWQGNMGQYSLIEDYDSRSPKKAVIAWFKEQILSEVSHSVINHQPVEEQPVGLPECVRARVAETLLGINGPPTNGKISLQRNNVLDTLRWTLQETHTHTVLIWHIATCYYNMFSERRDTSSDHKIAMTLSRYCAYLVAFHPQLLPDHSIHAKIVFQQVLEEAQESLIHLQDDVQARSDPAALQTSATVPLLGNIQTKFQQTLHKAKDLLGLARIPMEKKRLKIQVLQGLLTDDVNRLNTFEKGIKTGQKLVDLDSNAGNATNVGSWKVMADFWAETILYIAPSDNAAAHIELLAQGGQFVTHLWALLSNAGIFKRSTEQTNPPRLPDLPASFWAVMPDGL